MTTTKQINRLKIALMEIRSSAQEHPAFDLELYQFCDIDALRKIGGDVCDWTMIAIIANNALQEK